MLRLTSLLVLPLLALACGGTVTSSQSGGSTSGSGGSGAATSSSSSTSSSSTGTAGQGGSAGVGGSSACGTIELTVDSGAPRHYAANCAGDPTESSFTTAIGYVTGNPVQHTEWLSIVGCASGAAGAEGITLTAQNASGSGTYAMGTTQFTDAQGAVWGMASDPFAMVVTTWAATIDGTFSVTATKGGVAHALAGQFHVCHGADFLPP